MRELRLLEVPEGWVHVGTTLNRILAVGMAESGPDFLEVYRFFVVQGFTNEESFQFASRVSRGSTPNRLPFTKDIAYTKGFVLLYNFLRAAVNAGQLDLIPLIFCGKTVLEDVSHLRKLLAKGLLEPPAFIPKPYADLHGLAAWMCYDGVFATCGSDSLQGNDVNLFR